MNIGRTLEDDSLATRCLTLNSYLIDRKIIHTTKVRPKFRDVKWSTNVMIEEMASVKFRRTHCISNYSVKENKLKVIFAK